LTVEMWGKILIVSVLVSIPTVQASCNGRTVFTNKSGVVADNTSDNYPPYARCEWLIDGM